MQGVPGPLLGEALRNLRLRRVSQDVRDQFGLHRIPAEVGDACDEGLILWVGYPNKDDTPHIFHTMELGSASFPVGYRVCSRSLGLIGIGKKYDGQTRLDKPCPEPCEPRKQTCREGHLWMENRLSPNKTLVVRNPNMVAAQWGGGCCKSVQSSTQQEFKRTSLRTVQQEIGKLHCHVFPVRTKFSELFLPFPFLWCFSHCVRVLISLSVTHA